MSARVSRGADRSVALMGSNQRRPTGKYEARGAILAGAAKCRKKGHRGKKSEGWCTRCGKWMGRVITF